MYKKASLRSKRFRLVSEQRNTEEGDFRFWPREKWNESHKVKEGEVEGKEGRKLPHPLPALLLAPLFSRSLTLVPRSFLLNRTETLATQAKNTTKCCSASRFAMETKVAPRLSLEGLLTPRSHRYRGPPYSAFVGWLKQVQMLPTNHNIEGSWIFLVARVQETCSTSLRSKYRR